MRLHSDFTRPPEGIAPGEFMQQRGFGSVTFSTTTVRVSAASPIMWSSP